MTKRQSPMHVAHFNLGVLVDDIGSPRVAPFVLAIDRVNAVAERSAGFVWRHGDEAGAAVAAGWPLFVENPRVIASFSVWETVEHFRDFVHKTVHGAFLKRRAQWFEAGQGPSHVLWRVPAGHIPTIGEARTMYERLSAEGPGDSVFTLERAAPA